MSVASRLLWRFPSVLMAWRNLGRSRMRTALAVLGILIGVVAIASLGIAGVALQHQAQSSLGGLTDEVTISAGEDADTDGLTDDHVEDIRQVAGDATVIPQKSNNTELTGRSGQETRLSVTAVTESNVLYNVTAGEAPERLVTGALLSNSTAQQFGLELGDPVEYDGSLYRIRGLLASEDGFGPPGGGGGGELVLPLSALQEQEYYDSVTIVAEDGDAAVAISEALEERINADEEILNIQSFAGAQEQIGSFLNTLSMALLGIGSISLFVANVAILNVMLMSVMERRGEIGVLRAVGIRRGEVLRMILTESAFLGLLGGVLGVVISLGIGAAISQVLAGDVTVVLTWEALQYLVFGLAFAVGASLLSGLYPAWRAANDRPVESLRA